MKIEIIKQFRLLEVGRKLDTDREWSEKLIKEGYAKSLETLEEPIYQVIKKDGVVDIAKKVKKEK